MLKFSENMITRYLNTFFSISGIHIGIHDPDYSSSLVAGDIGRENVCSLVNAVTKNAQKLCRSCDRQNINDIEKTCRRKTYECWLGLTEAIVPISFEGTVYCMIFLGQVFTCEKSEAHFQKILKTAADKLGDIDPDVFRYAYDHTVFVSRKLFDGYTDLSEQFIELIIKNEYIQYQSPSISEAFRQYAAQHLDRHMSLTEIAASVNTSVSHLCRCVKKQTGATCLQYVTELKIEEAKRLLISTDIEIKSVAESLGYDNQNHFSKVFHQKTGMTATEYRERFRNTKQAE